MKEFLFLTIAIFALSVIIWSNKVEVFNEEEETDFTPFINAELLMIIFSIILWSIMFGLLLPSPLLCYSSLFVGLFLSMLFYMVRAFQATRADAIKNGIPLPKGHGRLGDLDALEQERINGIKAGNYEEGYKQYGNINNIDDCVDCVRMTDEIYEYKEVEKKGNNYEKTL